MFLAFVTALIHSCVSHDDDLPQFSLSLFKHIPDCGLLLLIRPFVDCMPFTLSILSRRFHALIHRICSSWLVYDSLVLCMLLYALSGRNPIYASLCTQQLRITHSPFVVSPFIGRNCKTQCKCCIALCALHVFIVSQDFTIPICLRTIASSAEC